MTRRGRLVSDRSPRTLAGVPFDPDRFRQNYPGRAFPELRFCAERRRWLSDRKLAASFGRAGGNAGNVLWGLFDSAAPLAMNARQAGDFGQMLARYGIAADGDVYLDWYLGDQARVGWGDLLSCFDAYWQKGVDDMAVFDDSFEWVLYLTRDGGVRLLRPGESDDTPDVAPEL